MDTLYARLRAAERLPGGWMEVYFAWQPFWDAAHERAVARAAADR